MFKKIILFILLSLLLIQPCFALGFEDIVYYEDKYELVNVGDTNIEAINAYDTYEDAYAEFDLIKENYDNLAITYKGLFLRLEYGIVTFNKTDACDYNVEFIDDVTGNSNYVNGCYGVDAAYIDTTINQKVLFEISGVKGNVDISEVNIIPLSFLNNNSLSSYIVKNGHLYHQIKNDITNDYFMNLIDLGNSPDYLNEDTVYYSYDGHYFYSDMYTLVNDLRSGANNSLNNANPYYNYYQYVSHRTTTNITVDELKAYYRDELGINDVIYSYQDNDFNSVDDSFTRSQFFGNEDSFYQYQFQYGANAAMMIALASNESAMGRSSLAFTRNNLFGHAAYDSDVEKNASRYMNVNSSVYSHAKYYISGAYCYPLKYQYHGGYFGNKASGMNVSYASDPYWGEKAAQYYYRLDEAMNFKDLNAYTLGIVNDYDVVNVYQYPQDDAEVLYTSGGLKDYAFVILATIENEYGSWYKIQSDATMDANSKIDLTYLYDFENNVAYVKKDQIDIIVEGNKEESTYYNVTFDSDGGTFRDGSSIVSYKLNSSTASIETPLKEGFVFVGWDNDLTNITSDMTFIAQYKQVDNIEMANLPKTMFELNDRIDLRDGTIKVNYTDGSNDTVMLNTSMVSNFDMSVEGDHDVFVTYGGQRCSYKINVSKQADEQYQLIKEKIDSLVNIDINKDNIDSYRQELKDLKEMISANRLPRLTFSKLRALDSRMSLAYPDVEYGLTKKYGLEVSGLATSLGLDDDKGLLKEYYKLSLKNGAKHGNFLEKIAKANEYSVHQTFTLSLSKRFAKPDFEGAIIVSIDKPDNFKTNDVYTVFEYVDNEIRKCYTTQTNNKIQFITNGMNEYIVTSKESSNHYNENDIVEVVNQDNAKTDIFSIIGLGVFGIFSVVLIGVLYVRFNYLLRKKKHDTKEDSVEENKISE